MYLIKNPNSKLKINFNEHIEMFSFFRLIYPDKRPAMKMQRTNENYIKNVSDIAAAVIAKTFTIQSNKEMIKKAINCCEKILHSKGYDTLIDINLSKKAASADNETDLVVVVLGCQDIDIIKSRVDAAIKLITLLHTESVKLFFSGANPGPQNSIQIPNESVYMYNYFQSRRNKNDGPVIASSRIELEGASRSTKENMKNILDKLETHTSMKSIWLFIVSSTSHLPQIDVEFSALVNHNIYDNIKEFILCGSEDQYTLKNITKKDRFIKQLFFSIYNNLMCSDKFYGSIY